MRVLFVTGLLAAQSVCESALQLENFSFSVKVFPQSVAALLPTDYIAKELKREDLRGYDAIIIPGMARGDASEIEEAVGIPTFKGTKYASDIPAMLRELKHVTLSKVAPADLILSELFKKENMKLLQEAENPDESVIGKPWNMTIGNEESRSLLVGKDFPMRVVAEILDAPMLDDDELTKRAKYYVESGAQIVDIGMLAGEPRPSDARRIVNLLKGKLNVPISIDTLNGEEIEAGLQSGVDMVLSLDSQNLSKIGFTESFSDVTVVVIPDRCEEAEPIVPGESAVNRVQSLEDSMEKASRIGFKKIVVDPIVDPLIFPGTVSSIVASRIFAARHPNIPLIAGAGNITELIDADSVGTNAVIAAIAQELGFSLLLTTEGSSKTKGAVNELSTACQMMYLAAKRKTPPKDLGLDLLRLKEKKSRELPFDSVLEIRARQYRAIPGREPKMDAKGCFSISIDRERNEVIVAHFKGRTEQSDAVVRGTEPLSIRDTLIKLGLVSTMEHAFYLGIEIEKACVAVRTSKSYVQDEDLFLSQDALRE